MMRICVTSKGDKWDAPVDPRFGRCGYFIFVNTESLEVETLVNKGVNASGGAGIQAAQLMGDHGIGAVLTGNVGPKAMAALKAGEIEVITGVTGTVREAVEKYKSGDYKITEEAIVKGHQ